MRLSLIQKDVLYYLYCFEQQKNSEHLAGMALLNTINEARKLTVADRNFRVSCHTLNLNGLIEKHRGAQLKLFWSLTEHGKEIAQQIYAARHEVRVD